MYATSGSGRVMKSPSRGTIRSWPLRPGKYARANISRNRRRAASAGASVDPIPRVRGPPLPEDRLTGWPEIGQAIATRFRARRKAPQAVSLDERARLRRVVTAGRVTSSLTSTSPPRPNGRAFSGEPSERSERPERKRGRRVRCNAMLGGSCDSMVNVPECKADPRWEKHPTVARTACANGVAHGLRRARRLTVEAPVDLPEQRCRAGNPRIQAWKRRRRSKAAPPLCFAT
jgi:hypothetical protein